MKNLTKSLLLLCISISLLLNTSCQQNEATDKTSPIRIYNENPFYWEYKGKPVLLLGGSSEDNLFNHPEGLEEELDLIHSVGGNYVRNTMSSRNPVNLLPHKMLDNGLYDLEQWNEDYWHRFENFLSMCYERDIIIQIEIWDPWDYFKTEAPLRNDPEIRGWESSPFNPIMNVNYTAEESGLATEIDYYTGGVPSEHVFFHTVPALKDITIVRKHQESFIDKLLSVSLEYPNVLYCMNNETGESPEWGRYWARYIRNKAEQKGKSVFLADMRYTINIYDEEHSNILHDRVHFDFFEISQNTQNSYQDHYDQIMYIRDQVVDQPKPLNNVKIYGGRHVLRGQTKGVEEAQRRFWRNIFGGTASSRFHREVIRPQFSGLAITETAQRNIRSMRMFTDEFHPFSCVPSNHLLSDREPNEAYCLAEERKQYALYFPEGGEVMVDLSGSDTNMTIRWMDIMNTEWLEEEALEGNKAVRISAPGEGQWAALILP